MIRIIDNKVNLSEVDYKAVTGIWDAFRSNLDYCADLLNYSNKHFNELQPQKDVMSIASIDSNIPENEYKNIFIEVCKNNNFIIC